MQKRFFSDVLSSFSVQVNSYIKTELAKTTVCFTILKLNNEIGK
jgi:hypothetical protein